MRKTDFQYNVWPLKDQLYRFAHRLLGDADEAADMVQEVFVKVLSQPQDGSGSTVRNWEAWCMTLVKNLSFDLLKSKRWESRRNELSDELSVADAATPDRLAEQADFRRYYQQLLQQLPAQQRAVVALREEEGKSYAEIAEVLGIQEGLVKATLSRARKSLREAILQLDSYRNDGY